MPMPHYSKERLRRSSERTLMKRWGAPEDAAKAVRFLAESNYVNGRGGAR